MFDRLKLSRTAALVSAAPSVLLLALFYSLAFHMRRTLGAWPKSIGEQGFPPLLVIHAGITVDFFIALALSTLFAVPIAIFVCLLVRRWECCVRYLALYAALFFAAWGLMQLAPEPFLYWWRD
jgi:hypothetical protein